jgi:hypothetical protein
MSFDDGADDGAEVGDTKKTRPRIYILEKK